MSDSIKQVEWCPRRIEDGRGPGGVFKTPETGDGFNSERCSYCGSMHPDEFMRLAENGAELVPTDKTYKVYVGDRKFYFQHLSVDQRKRFVELHNAKTFKLAFPGHFYVLPFFMVRA